MKNDRINVPNRTLFIGDNLDVLGSTNLLATDFT